jgi:Mg-chelatase subunit ChlD
MSAAPAFHGAMKGGQTVVYVLDCSGSMGEFGKLEKAVAALKSTLRRQPESVRFQVIAYSTAARSLVPGRCVPATSDHITAIETGLARLAPAGRSNHIEGVRAGAALQPDVIVLLTDTDNLTPASFRTAFAGRQVPVCLALVTADGVAAPRELR